MFTLVIEWCPKSFIFFLLSRRVSLTVELRLGCSMSVIHLWLWDVEVLDHLPALKTSWFCKMLVLIRSEERGHVALHVTLGFIFPFAPSVRWVERFHNPPSIQQSNYAITQHEMTVNVNVVQILIWQNQTALRTIFFKKVDCRSP